MVTGGEGRSRLVGVLIVSALVLIALGSWRIAVGTWGRPDSYLWFDASAAEAKLTDIADTLKKTEARIAEEGDEVSPGRKLARETDLRAQRQLLRDTTRWRDGIIEKYSGMEQRLGFYAVALGVGLVGVAIYQARRSAAGAPVSSS